jgi:phosphoribosylamine--glycine ligase
MNQARNGQAMKVLVIGSGGREHAIAWKLAQSARVSEVLVAPGNAGTASEPRVRNVASGSPEALVQLAIDEGVSFTVVGPEAPLAAGVVDLFEARGLRIFGPTRQAAQLESSKDFAKQFLVRHGIPTARHATFADAAAAHAHVDEHGAPIVVKADGLAAGKGVVVAMDTASAHEAIDRMLVDNAFGDAGARVVIEDFLAGEEASFIVVVDGLRVVALATSQDHKRLLDGDQGPNTGGMGAYSPAPVVTDALHARVMREIIGPTLAGLAADGIRYRGFLYAGLMISPEGNAKVLEFNCRLGDPETQPIMMRLQSDLLDLLESAVDGTLGDVPPRWDPRPALGVVLAAAGYPDAPRAGDRVQIDPPADPEVHVFHAGTRTQDGHCLTSGGRVLCVTALGTDTRAAHARAYAAIEGVRFEGMQFRRDIGGRALQRA